MYGAGPDGADNGSKETCTGGTGAGKQVLCVGGNGTFTTLNAALAVVPNRDDIH